ncbi:MAG TPA: hypothetical protein VEZ20_05565 [Allosphingosinicella sp.]|jgi:hypothetical protein|nr:hypothetical protein [Allosphingosinicella sp.]
MTIGTRALAVALIAEGAILLAAGPAFAQRAPRGQQRAAQPAQPATPAQPGQPQLTLSNAERAALQPLIVAHSAATSGPEEGRAAAWAQVQALLPAAQAAAQGNDARYLVARVQLAAAFQANDDAQKMAALDALIAAAATPTAELPRYLEARAQLAFAAQDFAGAERAYVRLLEVAPGNQQAAGNLAIVRRRMGNSSGAIETVLQSIAAAEAGGGVAEEILYRRARDTAYTSRDRRAAEFAVRLARNYPTATNWSDAIRLYRDIHQPSAALTLDTFRLAHAAGAIRGANDYLVFAQALEAAGLPGETKAVLDQAAQRGVIRAGDATVAQMLATATRRISEDRAGLPAQIAQARTSSQGRSARAAADALYGYGRYAEAAELYRLAATKTGEDPNILRLRLGAALAMAGRRAEAEAALGAVTGNTSELAKLWLAWLGRRAG